MSEPWHDSEPDDAEYSLLCPFVNQSPDFVLGIEAGRIWERMNRREQTIKATVHVENEDDLRQFATTHGYWAMFEPLTEARDWLTAEFSRSTGRARSGESE